MTRFASLWEAIHYWADAAPGREALRLDERALNYAELANKAEARACWLLERGVEPGDRVMIVGLNSIDWVLAYLAAMRLGAIAVPVNTRLSPVQMTDLSRLLGARIALTDDLHRPLFAQSDVEVRPLEQWEQRAAAPQLPPLPLPDVPALITFTSGTTGQPKGALLSTGALFEASAIFHRYFETGSQDSTLVIAPMFHNTGIIDQLGQMLIAGGSTALLPSFHRKAAAAAFRRSPASFVTAVPTVLRMMMLMDEADADAIFGPARKVLFGGSPMPAAWSRELLKRWPHLKLVHGYGMTEFSACSFLPPERMEADGESVGFAAPGVELRLVGDDGCDASAGEAGEIWVAGPMRMTGYWGCPEATAEKLSGKWLRTGDLGRFGADGLLFLEGRRDDVINRGGEKILPAYLESLLSERPDVGTCAVVGIPDPLLQQVPVAAVETRSGHVFDAETARAHMAANLPGYAVPQHFIQLEPMPRIASGKIDRRGVRDAIIARLNETGAQSGESHAA